jgi:acetyltransferase-like isoleucine patch superfamily enzyme
MTTRIIKALRLFEYIVDKFWVFIYKYQIKSIGRDVKLQPSRSVYLGLENLSIGDEVSIPRFAHIYCTDAPLTIGNKVLFGPAPTIITGNHRIDVIGKFIFDSHEKLPENDLPVTIEDDVWVGANVTILMGSVIGRGSVVAAGAVVNRKFPPYSIIGGIPAKLLKFRFSVEDIIRHEKILYPNEKRYSKEKLIEDRKEYEKNKT